MITVGGPIDPYLLKEGLVNVGNLPNPVNITFEGDGSAIVTDNIWSRVSTGQIYPTTITDRVSLGTTTFVGSERLRVSGETNTTSLRTADAYIDTARIRSGSYYANLTATLTATRSIAIPNSSGTLALTSDIYTFPNQALLATYSYTNISIGTAIGNSHTHTDLTALNGIEASDVSNWDTAFGWGDHSLAGYLTVESDPIFLASPAGNIDNDDKTAWNLAFSWGDHASAGYLTAETDPVFVASVAYGIDANDIIYWDTAYANTHDHANKTLLDSIISSGDGTYFLANDGTYKQFVIPSGTGALVYTTGGSSLGSDADLTYNSTTNTLTAVNSVVSTTLTVGTGSTIIETAGDLVFTDSLANTSTLAALIAGATNYWTTTTGGIYYSNYISNHTNPTAELDITGHIIATDFDSNYIRYSNSNILIGPNAGDNEAGNNYIYIHNTNTSNPIFKADMLNRNMWLSSNVYVTDSLYLALDDSIGLIGDLTYLYVTDPHIGTRTLYSFIDGSTNALVADFTDLPTVQAITSADTSIWNRASYIITTGSGDSYLSDDGTYKVISNVGNTTTLYLHDEASDIGGYEKLLNSPANNPTEDVETVAVTSGTSPVLIDDYATEPSYPGVTTVPAGLWTFKSWLNVDSATGTTTVTIRVYNRTTGGTETELFNVTTPEINATTTTQYVIETVQPEFTIDATDRIVIKYYTSTTSISSINVSLRYEGTAHYSYIITPLSFATTLINDYTWKWDTIESYYRPYTDKTDAGGVASDGKFYSGTTNPDATTRLNYDGNLHATNLYAVSGINSATATITGKLTVGGLIDPTGLQLTPVAANPGDANTLWSNSGASNALYYGSSVVNTVIPTDDILDWNTDKYTPYSSKQSGINFYTGTTLPDGTTRLNLNSQLYSTQAAFGLTSLTLEDYNASLVAFRSSDYAAYFSGAIGLRAHGSTYGIHTYSAAGTAIFATTDNGGTLLRLQKNNSLSANDSSDFISLTRGGAGAYNVTGNIFSITDNPSVSGTISGKLLTYIAGTTERISLNPRVTDGASAVAYFSDTHNNLTTTGAKLWSWRNQGSEKVYFDKDGNIDIASGANYKRNGTSIATNGDFEVLGFALSDVTSNLSVGTAKKTFHWPFNFTLTSLFIEVSTAPTGSSIIVDVNDSTGTSIFSTRVSIDATEFTSLTAATPYVLVTTSFTKGDLCTIDLDQVGATITGKELTIWFQGIKS